MVKIIILGTVFLDVPSRIATSVKSVQQTAQAPAEMAEAQAADDSSEQGDQSQAPAAGGDNAAGAEEGGDTPVMPGGQANEDLRRKQEELNRKEQSLKQLEKEIDTKLVKLQQLETKLQGMIEKAEQIKDDKLKHLIDVYSNMKAKQAATVLETLDPNIAVKILAGMRGRQAGEILTNVKAENAAVLTEMLTKLQAPFE